MGIIIPLPLVMYTLGDLAVVFLSFKGISTFQGVDNLESLGIPNEKDYVKEYCRLMEQTEKLNLGFYVAFTFFRGCSVMQGVYKRALQGKSNSQE